MNNSLVLSVLESIKTAHGLESNYRLARFLGIRDTALAHYVHGRSYPDEKACFKIAKAAGIDPHVFTAQVQALRSRDAETRSIWESLAARLSIASGTVATAILSAVFSITFVASDAYASSPGHDQRMTDRELTVYTSCIVLVVLLFWLLACNDSDSMARVTFPWVP